jgi:RNA polymerase sigma-70 factor (ECF subfamily)
MEKQEQLLIKKCQQGELENFSELYDNYVRRIYDFIYFKTYHKETAEDLTSQVFIKALEKIATYKEDRGSFNSWLYKIAANTVIDHYRTSKKDINIEDVFDLAEDNDLLTDLDAQAGLKQVRLYLKNLKPQQRNILIMRLWQNIPYSEIASSLNISEAACKMTYSRTIRQLRLDLPLAAFISLVLFNIK